MLAVQYPPFEEALNWLKLAYAVDREGAYVAHTSMVLSHSLVAQGDEFFLS